MAMKYLPIVPMAIFSLALQAQMGAPVNAAPPTDSTQVGQAQAGKTMPATPVSAELTKRIDTKSAKQGDEVAARVTSPAKLPNGTELPRGTKLTGKVTDVKAKSKEDKTSHLAFSLDRAVLKDGKEVPVVVIVTSVMGPAQGSAGDSMMPGGGAPSTAAGGSAGASGSSGSTDSAPAPSAPMVTNSGQSQSSTGGVLKNTQDRVPVGNMPGVILSATPGTAGTLDASGDNIELGSGTKLTLIVAPGTSPVGQ